MQWWEAALRRAVTIEPDLGLGLKLAENVLQHLVVHVLVLPLGVLVLLEVFAELHFSHTQERALAWVGASRPEKEAHYSLSSRRMLLLPTLTLPRGSAGSVLIFTVM